MYFPSRRQFLIRSFSSVAGLTAGVSALAATRSATGQEISQGPGAYPIAVAIGRNGAVFIADLHLQTIYRLGEDNNLTVVCKGSRKFRTPLYGMRALAQDSAENLFICSSGSMDVWRLSPDGKLFPLTGEKLDGNADDPEAGDGPEAGASDPAARYAGKLDKPMAIVLDPDGNPVVADLGLRAIVRIPAKGGEIQEIAHVPAPRGVALEREGGFVVVSHGEDQLLRVSRQGETTPIVKGRLAPSNFPHQVLVDQSGYIVSDGYARAIWRVTPQGKVKPIVQGEPLINPVGIALEADGNILVADPHAKKIFRVTPEGKVSVVVALPSNGN